MTRPVYGTRELARELDVSQKTVGIWTSRLRGAIGSGHWHDLSETEAMIVRAWVMLSEDAGNNAHAQAPRGDAMRRVLDLSRRAIELKPQPWLVIGMWWARTFETERETGEFINDRARDDGRSSWHKVLFVGHPAWAVDQMVEVRPDLVRGRNFNLVRHVDETGVSGVGVVAEGHRFRCGKVALCWDSNGSDVHQVAVFDAIEDVERVHGHNGSTTIEWTD